MQFSTYEQYQNQSSSEKCVLVKMQASERLVGWVVHSGSVYKLVDYSPDSIVSIAEEEALYTEVGSTAAIVPSTWYWDRINSVLYLETSGSVNPNGVFIAGKRALFFSNLGSISAPHDLNTGFEVNWRPLVDSTSQFGVELDNQLQIGIAISGKGSVSFYNDLDFWSPIYDVLYFENQVVQVWSWNRTLPISEAKLIYRGRVQQRSFSKAAVKFDLIDTIDELVAPVVQSDYVSLPGARVPEDFEAVKQRMVFGYVYQIRPINIDQELEGYPLSGTMTPIVGDNILTGTGTAFLNELHPGDEITIGIDEDSYEVKFINSDTSITLGDTYKGPIQQNVSSVVVRNEDIPNHWYNREFKICGHALREPTTTITAFTNFRFITVADATDIEAGDELYVDGARTLVDYVSGNQIKLTLALLTIPPIGATVYRPAVQNVYLDGKKLVLNRDYTYSAANGTFTLKYEAEKNVTRGKPITGTMNFSNTSRVVSGSGTLFTTELKPGDWIKPATQGDAFYYEISQIIDNSTLHLKTAATITQVGVSALSRAPKYYVEDDKEGSILVMDVLGRTFDGTTSGEFIKTGPQVVKQLLTDIGLGSLLSNTAFQNASNLTDARLGIVLPEEYDKDESPKTRDVINKINQSIFGSLVQNEDFELEYHVLRPSRPITSTRVQERDILSWSIKSDSSRLAKNATVQWANYDRDIITGLPVVLSATNLSANAAYLANTEKEYIVKSFISRQKDAEILAARYSFMGEIASSIISFKSKLRYARMQVTDSMDFKHEKIYQRLGTLENRKFGAIQSVKKTGEEVDIVLEDLANAFTRVCVITENDAQAWAVSDSEERFLNGFITDNYGMIDNDKATFNFNLIW